MTGKNLCFFRALPTRQEPDQQLQSLHVVKSYPHPITKSN